MCGVLLIAEYANVRGSLLPTLNAVTPKSRKNNINDNFPSHFNGELITLALYLILGFNSDTGFLNTKYF